MSCVYHCNAWLFITTVWHWHLLLLQLLDVITIPDDDLPSAQKTQSLPNVQTVQLPSSPASHQFFGGKVGQTPKPQQDTTLQTQSTKATPKQSKKDPAGPVNAQPHPSPTTQDTSKQPKRQPRPDVPYQPVLSQKSQPSKKPPQSPRSTTKPSSSKERYSLPKQPDLSQKSQRSKKPPESRLWCRFVAKTLYSLYITQVLYCFTMWA